MEEKESLLGSQRKSISHVYCWGTDKTVSFLSIPECMVYYKWQLFKKNYRLFKFSRCRFSCQLNEGCFDVDTAYDALIFS
jgi:hypothetical protein